MGNKRQDRAMERSNDTADHNAWPIFSDKHYGAPSVFRPEALLREARRQRSLPLLAVPPVCVLDPDGDLVRHLRRIGKARQHEGWACYHTELLTFDLAGFGNVGIIGCAVGASFAVLVAEQLFASGCKLLVSVTSAGRIVDRGPTPYFVLIDRALRDEGTSYHYLPPSAFAEAPEPALMSRAENMLSKLDRIVVHRGATWTTDAPYRETAAAIEAVVAKDVLAVEMEAAALYAFAAATNRSVVCLAHVTNAMAQSEGDFEKGEADGATSSLVVIGGVVQAWLSDRP